MTCASISLIFDIAQLGRSNKVRAGAVALLITAPELTASRLEPADLDLTALMVGELQVTERERSNRRFFAELDRLT